MPSAAKELTAIKDLAAFDDTFITLITKLSVDCIDKAAACTEQVFLISKDFLDEDSTVLLQEFYDLYFASAQMEQRKKDMNDSVDDIFDLVKENIDSGRPADQNLKVADEAEQERLGLAGLQKRIEGLIAVDAGMRNKIIPALSVMQFEDAVRQRLQHIIDCWKDTLQLTHKSKEAIDLKTFAKQLADHMTSTEETKTFYELVVKEPPPETGIDAGAALLF